MKKEQPSSVWLTAFAYIADAIAAFLQCIAMRTSYETNTNYFKIGAILPFVAILFAVVGAVCGILAACLMSADKKGQTPFSSRLTSSLSAAFGFLFSSVLLMLYGKAVWFTIPTVLILLLAAVYSVFCGTVNRCTHSSSVALLGFSAVIGCALLNAYYYFDSSVEMNAPVKVSLQTALLFAMLYYTGELRYLLGREKPRLYRILAHCTISACAVSSLPVMISYGLGITDRADYFAGALLSLGIAVTAVFRVQQTSVMPNQDPEQTANTVIDHREDKETL